MNKPRIMSQLKMNDPQFKPRSMSFSNHIAPFNYHVSPREFRHYLSYFFIINEATLSSLLLLYDRSLHCD